MKKIVLVIFSITITLIIISTCCEKSTSPSNDTKYVGWIVGTPGIGTKYGLIWKTTDSGENWLRQGDSLTVPLTELNAVKAVDSLTAWVVGGVSDGYATILNTVDGGNNWQRIGSRGALDNVELLGLHVVDNNTIWVVGAHGAVIMTDDGGDTWTSKADTSFSYYDITSLEIFDQHIWACGNGTGNQGGVIIHSIDGGDSWVKEAQSSFLDARGMIDISAPSDSCVWVVGHGRTILHTNNSGQDWEIQHALINPTWDANGITAISEKIAWTAEDTGIIRNTTDGGLIWTEQKNKPGNAAGFYLYRVSPVTKDIVWIIGTGIGDGVILYTTNGGEQWTEQDYSPDEMLNDVSFVGSNH
ncbi:MAG: hypothetical protein JW794_00145 [Candidatus Cloacimonetes bacterium]|nr:hypothetical protein [Candidatus Cloacimonadota bacterium]